MKSNNKATLVILQNVFIIKHRLDPHLRYREYHKEIK